MISDEELQQIRERAEEATPGPWVGDEFEMTAPKAPTITKRGVRLVWAEDYHINEWDAEFCKHARTDIPKLVAEVERINRDKQKLLNMTVEEYADRIESASLINLEKAELREKVLVEALEIFLASTPTREDGTYCKINQYPAWQALEALKQVGEMKK